MCAVLSSVALSSLPRKFSKPWLPPPHTQVPSHKFVPLTYQLASRIGRSSTPGEDPSGFRQVLWAVMASLALDHPHHTLTHLLALMHGNLDARGQRSRMSSSADKQQQQQGWDQVWLSTEMMSPGVMHTWREK